MKNTSKPSTPTSSYLRSIFLTTALAIGVTMSAPTSAASQCKGLDNSACDSASSCSWVNAYERKDGRKVNGFCRTKAKSAATKAKASQQTDGAKPGK